MAEPTKHTPLQPEEERKEKAEKNGGEQSLFSRISRFFGFIAKEAGEGMLSSDPVPTFFKEAHVIYPIRKTRELVEAADRVIKSLMHVKEELSKEFGPMASQFIMKSIDPMIAHASEIAKDLSEKEGSPFASSTIFQQALRSVGLYSELSNEKKLRRKIVNEAIQAIREAIEKDCQILRRYEHYAEDDLEGITDEFLHNLNRKLEPVFHEFHLLQLAKFTSDDLREFFLWKSQIDDRRAGLLELGLTTIDSHFSSLKSGRHRTEEEDEEPHFLPQFSAVEKDIIDSSHDLATIANLEERALQFSELIQDMTSFSPESFLQLDQLLANLKEETKQLKMASHPSTYDSFKALHEALHRAEKMLRKWRS